jgi:hypothetical protein
MATSITGRIVNKVFRPEKNWKEIEHFDERWKKRIEIMCWYIDANDKSVIDLWCWKMWLKDYLNSDIKYTWVDYINRWDDMITCDLNTETFPDISADTIFISWCLEYITDYVKFIWEVANRSSKVIISYCSLEDNPDLKIRRNLWWKNDLTKLDIVRLFNNNNFSLIDYTYEIDNNNIFIFKINEKI